MKYIYFKEDKTRELLKHITEAETKVKEFDEISENNYIQKSHILDTYNYSK